MSGSKQSRGGIARARSLTAEARSAIASVAAQRRWLKPEDKGEMPEAVTDGWIVIGDTKIEVYVLKDRRRLVSKRAMARALGLKSEGGNAFSKTLNGQIIGSRIPPKLPRNHRKPHSFQAFNLGSGARLRSHRPDRTVRLPHADPG